MGREIRRVPPDWQHPYKFVTHQQTTDWGRTFGINLPDSTYWTVRIELIPLYDEGILEAQAEWDAEEAGWATSEHGTMRWTQEDVDRITADHGSCSAVAGELVYSSHESYDGERPTAEEGYRPDWPDESRTAYQVYETVSEGTPVSPVFPTREELVAWLQDDPQFQLSPEAAQRFADAGSAPSFVVTEQGVAENAQIYEVDLDG